MICLLCPTSGRKEYALEVKNEARSPDLHGSPLCVTMTLSGNPRELPLIRSVVQANVPARARSSPVLNDIHLAVSEACTNVIRHAFHHDSRRRFQLHMEFSPARFQITVRYEDPDFVPEHIPAPDFSHSREGGWGVFLIRQIMDDVRYSVDPETGKVELRMIKILHPEEGALSYEN